MTKLAAPIRTEMFCLSVPSRKLYGSGRKAVRAAGVDWEEFTRRTLWMLSRIVREIRAIGLSRRKAASMPDARPNQMDRRHRKRSTQEIFRREGFSPARCSALVGMPRRHAQLRGMPRHPVATELEHIELINLELITLSAARSVGRILRHVPLGSAMQSRFSFFM
jgi:hypothetical protein